MYNPPHFREEREDVLEALIAAHPLAVLAVSTPQGLDAHHLPLHLVRDDHGRRLVGHVARANRVWQEVAEGSSVLAVFRGAEHYISPSWYATKAERGEVVPTWNYAIVHAHGTIHFHHDAGEVRPLVSTLTDVHEGRREHPWALADAPAPYVEKMLSAIVGFRIVVSRLEGKWKSSQNRNEADRAGVSRGLAADGVSAGDIDTLVRSR